MQLKKEGKKEKQKERSCGLEKGKIEGKIEGKTETARKLKENNVDIKIIETTTGLTKEEIEKL